MKVFRIEMACGINWTLTEKEMLQEFTEKEIKAFGEDPDTTAFETGYTVEELEEARRLYEDEDFCADFQDLFGYDPEPYDILKLKQ